MKYCLAPRSKLMSVSPPPGGSIKPAIALGGAPGEITRKVWPLSTEPNQVLRCVPVPVGPLTKTRPCGSVPMSGSPLVWIGSTTAGTSKAIPGAACAGRLAVDAAAARTMVEAATNVNRGRTIPCLLVPQQRAELVTPSVAHKVEAPNGDKAALTVGESGSRSTRIFDWPGPGSPRPR